MKISLFLKKVSMIREIEFNYVVAVEIMTRSSIVGDSIDDA